MREATPLVQDYSLPVSRPPHQSIAMKIVTLLLAAAFAAPAYASLGARDIDLDGSIDAYFDPLHHQTWLAQPTSVIGSAALYVLAYAEVASTFDGAWRLPLLLDTSVDAASCSADWTTPQVHCLRKGSSEVSRLASAYGNALPVVSWAGNYGRVSFADVSDVGLGAIVSGSQDEFWGDTHVVQAPFWFLADGDVGVPVQAIPEPKTYALVALGLLVIAWRRLTQRRPIGQPEGTAMQPLALPHGRNRPCAH
jgi:hypothetical protein